MRHLEGGGEYITPNISLIDDGKRVYSEKKVNNESNLITFSINGVECQAEEGMTFYEWAISDYFNETARLYMYIGDNSNLQEQIMKYNIDCNESMPIYNMAGVSYTPYITTTAVIQPIAYNVNNTEYPW